MNEQTILFIESCKSSKSDVIEHILETYGTDHILPTNSCKIMALTAICNNIRKYKDPDIPNRIFDICAGISLHSSNFIIDLFKDNELQLIAYILKRVKVLICDVSKTMLLSLCANDINKLDFIIANNMLPQDLTEFISNTISANNIGLIRNLIKSVPIELNKKTLDVSALYGEFEVYLFAKRYAEPNNSTMENACLGGNQDIIEDIKQHIPIKLKHIVLLSRNHPVLAENYLYSCNFVYTDDIVISPDNVFLRKLLAGTEYGRQNMANIFGSNELYKFIDTDIQAPITPSNWKSKFANLCTFDNNMKAASVYIKDRNQQFVPNVRPLTLKPEEVKEVKLDTPEDRLITNIIRLFPRYLAMTNTRGRCIKKRVIRKF